jgi:tRNA G18 (ribose-2'-O)-methylase SpoU
MNTAQKKPKELNRERRRTRRCYDHLYVAPLWVAFEANLGTLLRTCDAVGACMALPSTPYYRQALARGRTLNGKQTCVHWVQKGTYVESMKGKARIIGVELADDATMLGDVRPARERTIVCLGHEHEGLPAKVYPLLDEVVEIPMIGVGSSLNVAVAGSLVLYKLSGLI